MSDASKAGGGKRRTVLRVLTVALLAVLAAAAGAGAGYWVVQSWPATRLAAARAPEALEPGPMFALGSLMTNLADEGRPRFIQVSVEMEAADAQTVEQLTLRIGAVRDAVLRTLRGTAAADLEGPEGMAALAERLRLAVNGVLDRGEVREIYFQEFIIQ